METFKMKNFIIFTFIVINCLSAQTAKWDPIASMNTRRWYHAAVELENSEILVTGGSDITGYTTNSC